MIARHQDCRKADEPVTVLNHLSSDPRLFDRDAASSYSPFETSAIWGIRGYLQDASEKLQCNVLGNLCQHDDKLCSPFGNDTCLL